MAASASRIIKGAVVDTARLALAGDPSTNQVTVAYAYQGKEHERELVHGGRATSTQSYPVSGGGSPRHKRDSTVTVKLHIIVRIPGGTVEDAEDRACAIGLVIENRIATTADLGNPTGLQVIRAGIAADDLDSDYDDDSAIAVFTYDVEATARLT
jgi:hypothetical protein